MPGVCSSLHGLQHKGMDRRSACCDVMVYGQLVGPIFQCRPMALLTARIVAGIDQTVPFVPLSLCRWVHVTFAHLLQAKINFQTN